MRFSESDGSCLRLLFSSHYFNKGLFAAILISISITIVIQLSFLTISTTRASGVVTKSIVSNNDSNAELLHHQLPLLLVNSSTISKLLANNNNKKDDNNNHDNIIISQTDDEISSDISTGNLLAEQDQDHHNDHYYQLPLPSRKINKADKQKPAVAKIITTAWHQQETVSKEQLDDLELSIAAGAGANNKNKQGAGIGIDGASPAANIGDDDDYSTANFFERLWGKRQQAFYYDTRFRPNFRGKRVSVYCSAYIGSISSVSEENMDFTLDFYFRQSWLDYRLAYNETVVGSDSILVIPADYMDYLWRPPTFFANSKSSQFHYATRHNGFIRIRPTVESFSLPEEDIVYFWSADNGLSSILNNNNNYDSGNSDEEDYLLRTSLLRDMAIARSRAVGFHPNASVLPHLLITGYSVGEQTVVSHDGLNHSRIVLNIFFARNIGYYLIQVYLPATLMVITSWISFWISRNSAPARIALSVTTVLTIVTLSSQDYNASLPKLSYFKAIDLFHMTCFIFVFLVLVEYAIVSYASKRFCDVKVIEIVRRQRRRRGRGRSPRNNAAPRPGVLSSLDNNNNSPAQNCSSSAMSSAANNNSRVIDDHKEIRLRRHVSHMSFTSEGEAVIEKVNIPGAKYNEKLAVWPSRIEVTSRFLFPSAFLVFNMAYWSHYYFYQHYIDDIEDDLGFVRL